MKNLFIAMMAMVSFLEMTYASDFDDLREATDLAFEELDALVKSKNEEWLNKHVVEIHAMKMQDGCGVWLVFPSKPNSSADKKEQTDTDKEKSEETLTLHFSCHDEEHGERKGRHCDLSKFPKFVANLEILEAIEVKDE